MYTISYPLREISISDLAYLLRVFILYQLLQIIVVEFLLLSKVT